MWIPKFFNRLLLAAFLTVTFIFSMANTTAYAMTFQDVPESHWAYKAIDAVSNKGIIVGDLNSKFNPEDLISKFDTAKILAKLSGYKYTGVTDDEQKYYDECYKKHSVLLNLYMNKFKKWNSNYNKEIAYLLEKKILVEIDLYQFVVINLEQEYIRNLTHEEACMFMTKVMGKADDAAKNYNSVSSADLFKDNSSISLAYRPYVYYLKSLKIIGGEADNNFKPKNYITRAYMSNIIYFAMNYMDSGQSAQIPAQTEPPVATPVAPVPTQTPSLDAAINIVEGSVDKIYNVARAVQISSDNAGYDKKVYRIPSTASITIDGSAKTFEQLAVGMSFTGISSGNDLVLVKALSVPAASTSANPSTPANTPTVSSVQPLNENTVSGIIASTSSVEDLRYVYLQTKIVSPSGDTSDIIITYLCDKNMVITRGTTTIPFSSVVSGDIAVLSVRGLNVYEIRLTEKDVNITGSIEEKKYDSKTGAAILSITSNGAKRDLRMVSTSLASRNGIANVTWNDLRVGDRVTVVAEFDTIKSINCIGTSSIIDVWVKDILISGMISKITAIDTNNNEKIYPLINGMVDPYSIRVGSKIRLALDSSEVKSYSLLANAKAESISGVVTNITGSTITLRDDQYSLHHEISYGSDTLIVDSTTGQISTISSIKNDMVLFVIFSWSNYAKTITILSR